MTKQECSWRGRQLLRPRRARSLPLNCSGLGRIWKMLNLSRSAVRPGLDFRVGSVPAAASGDRLGSASISKRALKLVFPI